MGWDQTVAITVVPNGSSALLFSKSQFSHRLLVKTELLPQAPHQVGWVSMGWETLRIKRLPSQLFPKVQVKRLSFLQTPIVSQAAGENAAATHFSHYLQRSACMQGLYHTRLGTYLCSFECNASGGKSWVTERTFWRLDFGIRFR